MAKTKKAKRNRQSVKAGDTPGELVYIGQEPTGPVGMELIEFTPEQVNERPITDLNDLAQIAVSDPVSWINITGVHDPEVIGSFRELFSVHPLVMEDVMDTLQRPKVEFFEKYVFFTLKMIVPKGDHDISVEQVSLILGDHYVVSFQERSGDLFDPIRTRIRQDRGRVRGRGPDYLFYLLIDTVVDQYYQLAERMNDYATSLEEPALEGDKEILEAVRDQKKQIQQLKRAIHPLRDALSKLEKEAPRQLQPVTLPYIRDVYDHVLLLGESLETNHDLLSGLTDLYVSGMSNKMNEVMRVLTIIATIFIPLTFIAGIYGMNFKIMPELGWDYGYPIAMGLMVVITLGMLVWFRRKKWL